MIILLLFIARYFNVLLDPNLTFGLGKDITYLLGPTFSNVSGSFFYDSTWIPGMLGGMQIYDNPQFSITYPFFFFNLIDYGIGHEAHRTITLIIIFHFLILLINSYILLRILKFKKATCLVCCFLILIFSNFARYSSWVNILSAYAWFPLFIAGIYLVCQGPNRLKGSFITAIACFGFLANPAQPIIHAFYLGITLLVVSFIVKKGSRKAILKYASLTGILSFLLTSASIIPIILSSRQTRRFIGKLGSLIGSEKMPIEALFEYELPLHSISDFVLNNNNWIYGPGHHYIGPIAAILMLIGLISKAKNEKWFYNTVAFFGIYFIISAFGRNLGLTYINYKIPLINLIREPIRHIIYFNFFVLIFSALGLEYIVSKVKVKDNSSLVRIISSILIFSCIYNLALEVNLVKLDIYSLLLLSPSLLAIFFLSKWITPDIIYIIVFALVIFNFQITEIAKFQDPNKTPPHKEELNLASLNLLRHLSTIEDAREYRTQFHTTGMKSGAWSQNALYYDLRSNECQFFPIINKQWEQLMFFNKFFNYRSYWGTKWFVLDKSDTTYISNNALVEVHQDERYKILENQSAYNRFYLSKNLEVFEGSTRQFARHIEEIGDLNSYVTFCSTEDFARLSKTIIQSKNNSNPEQNQVRITSQSKNKIVLNVSSAETQLLILNEFYNKNWSIEINGDKAAIIQVNNNQMAVLVKSGIYEVTIKYRPIIFTILRLVQILTLLLIIFFSVLKFKSFKAW